MNKKEVVIFGFTEEQEKRINGIAENFQASFKSVKGHMINLTIENILNNETAHTENIYEKGSEIKGDHKNIINEKVILFNDFNESEIPEIIKSIRENKDLGCILAVVTPTSIKWTFSYLVSHLMDEREWFLKNKQTNRS